MYDMNFFIYIFQTDLFGLAGTIHVLVFDQYMNVYQTGGEWRMTQGFARYVQEDMGQP